MLSKDNLFSLQFCSFILYSKLLYTNIFYLMYENHSSKEWTVRSHSKIIILENFLDFD